ncbi:YdcF family protein [Kribbella catacumbae]|uniref:YdcF family protein n=1 Tax=Kribbella catacumbae TaxID=460086 RepID=UPI0007C59AB1|nr:YdcF family protein [Kribbella catacumbae]
MSSARCSGQAEVDTEELTLISTYLARRDVAEIGEADLLVLMGSAVLESVEVAARAWQDGLVPRILISGGVGHSTRHLVTKVGERELRPESQIFRDLLTREYGVPAAAIEIEDRSTNCGQNAEFSRPFVDRAQRIVLVQDPTMQRRTHASFVRSFRDLPGTELISFAPVIPWIGPYGVAATPGGPAIWGRERFASLVLGEIRRLRDDEHGYGPRGRDFIDHVDLPAVVLDAYGNLSERYPGLVRAGGG